MRHLISVLSKSVQGNEQHKLSFMCISVYFTHKKDTGDWLDLLNNSDEDQVVESTSVLPRNLLKLIMPFSINFQTV